MKGQALQHFYYIKLRTVLAVLILLFFAAFSNWASAQSVVPRPRPKPNSGAIVDKTDTSINKAKDTISSIDKFKNWGIKISKDAIENEVVSTARDSAVFDMETNMFYLYGDASITQEALELKSGVVAFDQKNNVVAAYPEYDTANKKISEQTFQQGEEIINFDSLRYNFKSKRALVRNARMQYGDAYINSFQIKRNPDQSIYGYKNVYTTCDLEHPHFGIYAKKIKVIPNKVAASGMANLQIADLPTPLLFPFGIFPINPQQKSGFILPTYTMEGNRGMGLQKIGYYLDINKYIGASVTFDIFSKGSYGIFASTQYSKRYHFSGAFNFDYTYSKFGDEFDLGNNYTQKDFRVNWRHTVDPKAMPGASFSANVNFGTGSYNRVNGMTADVQTNNTMSSSVSYSKTWVGKPYAFTAGMRHNQNTQTGQVSVTLPEISFNIAQLTPFQSKNRIGKPKWFEKISASYNFSAQNRYNFNDSGFSLNTININDFSNGIKQSINLSATYNVLRFINWNFSVPYNEYWNTKQQYLTWNSGALNNDTTVLNGFFASRDFSVTSSMSTRIYGLALFKKGKIAGIRHVITPSLNFNYTPGFARPPYQYFHEYYDRFGDLSYQSLYYGAPFGGPGNPLPNGSVGISIGNNLQMKLRTKDSVGTKNISLIDGLGITANYNFFADSNNLSAISFNGRTSIAQKFNISFAGSFDPYAYEGGKRTKYYALEKDNKLATLRSFNVGLDFTLNGPVSKKDQNTENDRKESEDFQRMLRNNGMNDYYDFNIPWNLMVRSSVTYYRRPLYNNRDTIQWSPNLTIAGSLRFTPKMMFNFTTGYDFVNKKPGATTFNITRDLHCWQMMLNVTPLGVYRNYNFTLNVKSSVLQDLKLTRRKAFQDNY